MSAADAIAFARNAGAQPPGGGPPDARGNSESRGNGQGPGGDDEDPGGDEDPGAPGPNGDGDNHGENQEPDGDGDGLGPGGPGPDGGGGDGPGGGGDGPGGGSGHGGGDVPGGAGDRTVLPEVTVPLVTLQGRAARAGESRLLGPLDPALARELAAAAAKSPDSRWGVTIVDDQGYAVGHGIARPGRGSRQRPRPPGPAGYALPARVNVTVTEARLHKLAKQAAQPRPGAPPGGWDLAPRAVGSWALTLPGGRELAVRFDVVPTHECDHRQQVSSYQPSERLRRLVQVRDQECTFPTCSRPASQSDFEHAVPYDQGGRTDACNAGARSRRCHQVKQSAGWTVTQPKPGWHVWTTPTGRTYVQEPWRYIA
ncbi:MAG TPA: hypothetical protein VGL33_32685 [Streptosporangiaceae bacterium]